MTFPRQLERLVQSHVQSNVARSTEHVSVAVFARSSTTEAAISSKPVLEDIWLSFKSIARRRRFDGLNSRAVRLHVPVRGPNTAVKRCLDRESTIPTEDSRRGPTAQHLINEVVSVTQVTLAATKRKSNDPVCIDDMTRIE